VNHDRGREPDFQVFFRSSIPGNDTASGRIKTPPGDDTAFPGSNPADRRFPTIRFPLLGEFIRLNGIGPNQMSRNIDVPAFLYSLSSWR